MKMFRHARLALALAVAGLSLPPAHALSFDSVPAFDAMVAAAPLAFRGKVLRIADGQAKAAGGAAIPYTSITLRVGEPSPAAAPAARSPCASSVGASKAT